MKDVIDGEVPPVLPPEVIVDGPNPFVDVEVGFVPPDVGAVGDGVVAGELLTGDRVEGVRPPTGLVSPMDGTGLGLMVGLMVT
jgi:hypothetical protein